jgi:hypothetical protein
VPRPSKPKPRSSSKRASSKGASAKSSPASSSALARRRKLAQEELAEKLPKDEQRKLAAIAKALREVARKRGKTLKIYPGLDMSGI